MQWDRLLCPERIRKVVKSSSAGATDLRSEFEKDYHRIIGSASFRRLQDKTQVFPLDKSDFIRTRLTHSLEVSSFARSLGQNIGEYILSSRKEEGFTPHMKEDICSILQCAGLIHDIGNPPFGHFGEEAIRDWFVRNLPSLKFSGRSVEQLLSPWMREDFYHFEGNAQALRLVTRLHYLVDENGMNLTYALLNTIIKYPVSSMEIDPKSGDVKNKKMGYFYAEDEIFQKIVSATGAYKCRHPLTFILEAADDLAYSTADIEDAFVKGFISYGDLEKELAAMGQTDSAFQAVSLLHRLYERGVGQGAGNPAKYALKNWIVHVQGFLIGCATFGFIKNYESIMDGTYPYDIFHGTQGEDLLGLLQDMAARYVFLSKDIFRMELRENTMFRFIMDRFVQSILYYDTKEASFSIASRLAELISDNYKKAYKNQANGKSEAEKLYLRLLLVTDYVSGMTDSYAKRLYQELNGMG